MIGPADIRGALQAHLAGMSGTLPTAWEGVPPEGLDLSAPYQKAFVLPSPPQTLDLRQQLHLQRGVFQVTLCYPSGVGTRACELYAQALREHFRAGTVLFCGGAKVTLTGVPHVAPAVSYDPLTVPVSISFETFL